MVNAAILTPRPGWIPLRRAPFCFRNRRDLDGSILEGTSLIELADLLKYVSGAEWVDVAPDTATFDFRWQDDGTIPRHPCEILSKKLSTVESESDETSYDLSLFDFTNYNAMRRATDQIWNQLMIPEFNTSVREGRVRLFARPEPHAAFNELFGDVWASCTVIDWQGGAVRTPDSVLFSVHVFDAAGIEDPSLNGKS